MSAVTGIEVIPGRSYTVDQRVATVDVVVDVPVTLTRLGWQYNDQLVKAGGEFVFETRTYSVRGWILSMELNRNP